MTHSMQAYLSMCYVPVINIPLYLLSAPPKIMIDKKLEDTIIVNANKSAIIEVPFTCHPAPKITWQYNGGKLPNPHRMTHETIYSMTALTISRAERGDTGSYSVVIENPHGKVTATVKVQVIGKWESTCFTLCCFVQNL